MIATHETVRAWLRHFDSGRWAIGRNSSAIEVIVARSIVDLRNTILSEERAIGITEITVQTTSSSVIAVVKVFRFDEQCFAATLERPTVKFHELVCVTGTASLSVKITFAVCADPNGRKLVTWNWTSAPPAVSVITSGVNSFVPRNNRMEPGTTAVS
jgi:hypothetical protein